MADWNDEVARLNIAEVADKLGLRLTPGRRAPRTAICPFHNDEAPSLHLYQDANPHYHCFACHAHGDTVELVKQRLRVDFAQALDWLAVNFSTHLRREDLRLAGRRRDIRLQALEFWQQGGDGPIFAAFAKARRFTPEVLRKAGLLVGSVEAFLASLGNDRNAQDEAVAIGLPPTQASV
jgi:DNA primase